MAQAVAAESAIGQWYLFMGDGICLKVSSDLCLGEDADGLLVLNPRPPASVLLRVKKDESGRLLIRNVSKKHVLDFETGNATMVGEELSLVSGSKVELPHNELYFNHEMQRGKISARIVLQAVAEQTGPIEVLVDVVPESARKIAPKIAPKIVETQALEPVNEEVPAEVTADAVAEPIHVQAVFAEPKFAEPKVVASVPTGQAAAYRKRFLALGGITLTAVLAAVLVAVMVDDKPLAPQGPLAQEPITPELIAPEVIAPELMAPEQGTQEQRSKLPFAEVRVAEVQVAELPDAELNIVEAAPAEAQPESTLAPITVDTAVDRQTAERLERAMSYLDQGFITLPRQSNAVRELSLILWADPTNQEAMLLMSEAANRLVDAAVEAQAAGLEFEARNLLEEVLGFHPDHQQANEYWRQWTGLDR